MIKFKVNNGSKSLTLTFSKGAEKEFNANVMTVNDVAEKLSNSKEQFAQMLYLLNNTPDFCFRISKDRFEKLNYGYGICEGKVTPIVMFFTQESKLTFFMYRDGYICRIHPEDGDVFTKDIEDLVTPDEMVKIMLQRENEASQPSNESENNGEDKADDSYLSAFSILGGILVNMLSKYINDRNNTDMKNEDSRKSHQDLQKLHQKFNETEQKIEEFCESHQEFQKLHQEFNETEQKYRSKLDELANLYNKAEELELAVAKLYAQKIALSNRLGISIND